MEIKLPLFDHVMVETSGEVDFDDTRISQALSNFLNLSGSDRENDRRHILAYCECSHSEAEQDGWKIDSPIPTTSEELWQQITPRYLFVHFRHDEENTVYVSLEGDCEWEEEHGIQMVWRNGETLCKVGPYDGHPTNANAYGDQSLSDVIFYDPNGVFTTTKA